MTTTNSPSSMRLNLLAGAVALIVMAIAFFAFGGSTDDVDVALPSAAEPTTEDSTPATTEAPAATTDTTTMLESAPVRFSDLPTISIDALPIEAIDTLFLIADGGPYPYRQDDGTFQNREGILPDRDAGHYREYTVDTPGSPDRGARRIVSGADGERYYTDDHYDSFREIVE